MLISIYESNGKRKAIGRVEAGVFIKHDAPKGQRVYHRLEAIAIDSQFWNNVIAGGGYYIKEIIALDDDDRAIKIETAEVAKLIDKGEAQYRHHKPHRAQIFIPLRFWKKRSNINEN